MLKEKHTKKHNISKSNQNVFYQAVCVFPISLNEKRKTLDLNVRFLDIQKFLSLESDEGKYTYKAGNLYMARNSVKICFPFRGGGRYA